MRYFFKILVPVSTIYALTVSIKEVSELLFFTTLSNVVMSLVMLLFLFKEIRGEKKTNRDYLLKYLSTCGVVLTFTVFMFILAPTQPDGFIHAYVVVKGSSFCLHFLNPVCSVADFLIYDYEYESGKKDIVMAVVPPLLYLGLAFILGKLGMRWSVAKNKAYQMSMPYNFLNYEAKAGWFGFESGEHDPTTIGIGVFYVVIVLVVVFAFLGIILLKLKDLRKRAVLNSVDRSRYS